MRSISRVTDVSINTVTRYLVVAGEACSAFHDVTVRNVAAKRVQCDEIWSFCGMKGKTAKTKADNRPANVGDVWTWTAIDADSKLIVTWLLGGRDSGAAYEFMVDVAGRLANRVQLTTDGHAAYLTAVPDAFGRDVDSELLALRDSITAEYPNLVLRAEAADLYWKDRVDEFVEDSASPYSFRGMYRQLYRHASSIVHPSLLGLNRVTTKNPDGTRSVHMEAANQPPFPIGLTAVVLGAAVIVSEHALGWPTVGAVDDVVARHNWVPPRPESN